MNRMLFCLQNAVSLILSRQIPVARHLPIWRGNIIDANLEMFPSRVVGMSLPINSEGGVPGAKTGPVQKRKTARLHGHVSSSSFQPFLAEIHVGIGAFLKEFWTTSLPWGFSCHQTEINEGFKAIQVENAVEAGNAS
ncbi:hypothetical protein ACH5RR_024298 [Cinchona calisaya]|uniref:Uncharacterized protein n=1 Tax=Cinchona calisaya TaxID=153742 RepID=A0ABD2YW88_9GENT